MTKNNVFTEIAERVFKNWKYNKEQVLEFKGYYPQGAIVYLTTKQKAFKVESVKRTPLPSGAYQYTVKYTDLYKYADFLGGKIEKDEYKTERAEKKGWISDYTGAVSTKMCLIHDKYRDELECKNYEKRFDNYERLEKEDDCIFMQRLNGLGFESYGEFLKANKDMDSYELAELIKEMEDRYYLDTVLAYNV